MSIASKMIFEDAIKLGKGDLDFAAIFETYKK